MARDNAGSGALAGRRGCGRDQAVLRRHERALEPGRQRAARTRRPPRRPHPGHARQRRGAVGMHAGGDEARRGHRAGDDAAHPQRSRRPFRPRARAPRHRQRRGRGQIRRPARRLHPHCRRQGRAGLGFLSRTPTEASAEFAPDGETRAGRSGAALFHLRHHGDAETRSAQPPELSGRPSVDDVLARAAAGRRASQHLVAGLGQARLELFLFAVERASGGLHRQSAPLQCARSARHHRALRRHHVLRAADGVADADPGGAFRLAGPHQGTDQRRRAAQSGGHRAGQGGLGYHHPRRLRPDRDDGAGRQYAGPDSEARLDGPAAAGLSRRAARCERRAGQRGRNLPGAASRGRPD